MREGAESYLPKPFGGELVRAVTTALERRAGLGREGVPLRAPQALPPKGLVGQSPSMAALLSQIALIGPTRTTVLLLGETGTGKERLAQALHDASPRRNAPFVAVNCAALAETLLESELFGHEKGAFSGAVARREGRFKLADGGTIFLDEIGEISPAIQVKLLRVLQERRFERVGGNETVSVDVRVIAATNRNLREMVEAKTFRADLYYRLNVVALEVPPLRARIEDIPPLVDHILPRLAAGPGRPRAAGHAGGDAGARARTSGRATCASSRTSSSARWCCRAASRSRSCCCRASWSPARCRRARRWSASTRARPRSPARPSPRSSATPS